MSVTMAANARQKVIGTLSRTSTAKIPSRRGMKVTAVIHTSLEISSIQEIPESKPYLQYDVYGDGDSLEGQANAGHNRAQEMNLVEEASDAHGFHLLRKEGHGAEKSRRPETAIAGSWIMSNPPERVKDYGISQLGRAMVSGGR